MYTFGSSVFLGVRNKDDGHQLITAKCRNYRYKLKKFSVFYLFLRYTTKETNVPDTENWEYLDEFRFQTSNPQSPYKFYIEL